MWPPKNNSNRVKSYKGSSSECANLISVKSRSLWNNSYRNGVIILSSSGCCSARGRLLKRTVKIHLMLNDEELGAIDDWRFTHRLPSRAAAVRELMRRGLLIERNQPDGQASEVKPHD